MEFLRLRRLAMLTVKLLVQDVTVRVLSSTAHVFQRWLRLARFVEQSLWT